MRGKENPAVGQGFWGNPCTRKHPKTRESAEILCGCASGQKTGESAEMLCRCASLFGTVAGVEIGFRGPFPGAHIGIPGNWPARRKRDETEVFQWGNGAGAPAHGAGAPARHNDGIMTVRLKSEGHNDGIMTA